ncbi:hypothetical protein BDA99DRAFT_530651 [Phascolomyces articulosus]|uniref:Uncharacterized protein n=1 Tax=Phascolomyces articulosus TaxID=60185 RepID=A0AAD5P6R3_9FUNG|nr:hypothetical protein BDA99DRAFT_530651 [Phascolomyces articulosus]
MLHHAKEFYQILYTPHPVSHSATEQLLSSIPPDLKITPSQQSNLTKPITSANLLA